MTDRKRDASVVPSGLVAALLIALAGRVLLLSAVWVTHQDPRAFLTPDGHHYLELAASIATSATYGTARGLELMRVPGYPAFLSVGSALGHPIPFALAANVALGLVTTLLCFATAREIGGRGAGVAAAALYACEPGQWVWGAFVLSETLLTSLVVGACWCVVRYQRSYALRDLLTAALLASLAGYVRIVGYPLAMVLVTGVVIAGRRSGRTLAHACAAIGLAVIVLGAWHLRNGVVSGYWGFSQQFERAVYLAAGASVEARRSGTSFDVAARRLADELPEAGGRQVPEAETARDMRQRGWRILASDPMTFAGGYVNGLVMTMIQPHGILTAMVQGRLLDAVDAPGGPGTAEFIQGRWERAWQALRAKGSAYWALAVVEVCFVFVLYALAVSAVWLVRPRARLWALVLPVLCILAMSGGPHGGARFRAPVMPAVAVLAGFALANLQVRRGSRLAP